MAARRSARLELTTSRREPDTASTQASPPEGAQRRDGACGARLLLAEDDLELRRLLALALRKDGHKVVEVSSGTEFQEHIERCVARGRAFELPDVIVTDLRMPGPSGLEVIAALRRADWTLPIVLITAFGDRETRAHARRLGAVVVLEKPFDMDDLRTIVMNATRLN